MVVLSVHGTRLRNAHRPGRPALGGAASDSDDVFLKRRLKQRGYFARHWPGQCGYCGYNVDDQRKPCPNCRKITDTTAE